MEILSKSCHAFESHVESPRRGVYGRSVLFSAAWSNENGGRYPSPRELEEIGLLVVRTLTASDSLEPILQPASQDQEELPYRLE